MFIGWRMWVRASETIAAGIVAENSIVWRVSGVCLSRRSTSGRKPRSSISSASSRTSDFTWEMSSALRFIRSIRRPGVPTTTSTPAASASSWRLVGHAAVDGEHADAAVLAGHRQVLAHLERELTGRGDDQRLRLAGGGEVLEVGVVLGDGALQHRDAEGERLAGAGAGLADQVGAHQGDREGHLLDGEGGHDVGALEGVCDLGEYPELSEGGQDLACSVLTRSRESMGSSLDVVCRWRAARSGSASHSGDRQGGIKPAVHRQSIGRVPP